MPGTYHIKNDIVCQDYHAFASIQKKIAVASVADGLGSAEFSDVGSKIAATVAVEFCKKNLVSAKSVGDILDTIRSAFSAALRAVEKEANAKDRDVALYDTTLTLAVLFNDNLLYGHSGDSGMIALTTEGRYEQVTKQQQDEQGRVFPLFFEDKWVIEVYDKKVSAVMLATDGMLESFFPLYIRTNDVNIHVSLVQFFMDNSSLRIDKVGSEAVTAKISKFMENIPDEQVNDDKTVAVLINPSVKTKRQPKEYYQEPNWDELKRKHDEEWKRAAYPGLYKNEEPASEHNSPVNRQAGNSVNVMTANNLDARNVPLAQLSRKPKFPKVLIIMFALVVVLGIGAGVLVLFYMSDGGNVLHGHDTFVWGNGDKYIGDWHNGTRHGQGTYIWAIDNVFIGYWYNGQRIEGIVTWPDGSRFEGSWADDRPNHGTFTSPDGIARTGAVVITETNSGWSWHIP